jgi:hypothetical protein
MNAEPVIVYTRNFIAEYSRRPVPQIEISRNIGTSSISQNRKKSRKSSAVKIDAPGNEDGDNGEKRRQNDERQAETIDADVVLDIEPDGVRANPRQAVLELESRRRAVIEDEQEE